MIQVVKKNLSGRRLPLGIDFENWLKKSLVVLGKVGLYDGKIDSSVENNANKSVKQTQGLLELYFVDSKEIQRLNKQFRGNDKSTDVLSFSFLNTEKFPGEDLVGQIFIEPLIAKKQALEHELSWKEELEFLFVHGVLHIFGLDHEKAEDFQRMFKLHAQIMPDPKWGNFVEQIYQEHFGKD